MFLCVHVYRVIDIDSADSDNDDGDADEAVMNHHPTFTLSLSCPPVAWDLSRAALQVEQMIEPRYRTSPLGNSALLISWISGQLTVFLAFGFICFGSFQV